MPQFKKVAAVERELKRTTPIIRDQTIDINERGAAVERLADIVLDAANEVKNHANKIKKGGNVIDAAIGQMLESQEMLSEFVEKAAQDATLLFNLKAVFFKSDPKMLRQILEEMEPDTRREAWKRLSPALLTAIVAEIEQGNYVTIPDDE